MRILFAGTPEFAVAPLQALLASPHQVAAVFTQPDRPAGRGRRLTPSPVKQLALEHGIAVHQPSDFKAEADRRLVRGLGADLMVVVAYGLLLPQAVLDAPRLGCINVHASLLPRWRGAAPIQRAIAAGDPETGVCIMRMEAGLDTGPVHLLRRCPIGPEDNAQTLHDRLAALGAEAVLAALPLLEQPDHRPRVQDPAKAVYARKLSKGEALLDWRQDALTLDRLVRAYNPWPVAETRYRDEWVRLWRAVPLPGPAGGAAPGTILACGKAGIDVATGDGILRITQLQMPGKRAMTVAEFVNAQRLEGAFVGR
jgi:methionyl-tRNA formyltransferase